MTTPHISSLENYPFLPAESGLHTYAQGILDLFFIVQGPPTGANAGDSSSSAAVDNASEHGTVFLQAYSASGGFTTYTFIATLGSLYWEFTFTVSHTGGLGVVTNDAVAHNSKAVLTFNSEDIIKTGSATCEIPVEPSRVVFLVDRVTRLRLCNVHRCGGVEDLTRTTDVWDSDAAQPLRLVPGYNCEVAAVDDALVFTGGVALGRGIAPAVNIGDTGDCASSSSGPSGSSSGNGQSERVLVRSINGLVPGTAGDISVRTSRLIGMQKQPGRLTLIVRQV